MRLATSQVNVAEASRALRAVVCSHGVEPRRLTRALTSVAGRLRTRLEGVIVCNGDHPLPEDDVTWRFIRGSNNELDFSAYHEGAAVLSSRAHDPPSVLFLNDSTFTRHNAYHVMQALLAYRQLVEDADVPVIAGKTDRYDNFCYANPWSGLPVYVSSFCFLLNRLALPVLQTVQRYASKDLRDVQADFRSPTWGRQLPRDFRCYVRAHLAYPGNSISWYQLSARQANAGLMIKKLRCVYSEHRLSGEIGRDGLLYSIYPSQRLQAKFFFFEQTAKLARRIGFGP